MLLFLRSKRVLCSVLFLVFVSGLVFLFLLSQTDEVVPGEAASVGDEVSESNQETEIIELPVPDTVEEWLAEDGMIPLPTSEETESEIIELPPSDTIEEWLAEDGMIPTPTSEETESEIIELPAPDMPEETDEEDEQDGQ